MPSQPIEERFPNIIRLTEVGRERGYLLSDEVFELLPDGLISWPGEILDEIYEHLHHSGISILTPEEHERRFSLEKRVDLETASVELSDFVNTQLINYFLKHPEEMYLLSPRKFEELVGGLFEGFGYDVEFTARTRDGGYDIVAVRKRETFEKNIIECKRYSPANKVSVKAVRALYGVQQSEAATKAVLATTSFFTVPAENFFRRHIWALEPRDFDGILKWLNLYLNKVRCKGGP